MLCRDWRQSKVWFLAHGLYSVRQGCLVAKWVCDGSGRVPMGVLKNQKGWEWELSGASGDKKVQTMGET